MNNNRLLNTFGRRIGKRLGQNSREAISTILPQYAFSAEEIIATKQQVTLEIGFGTGDFLLEYAKNYPDKICIGCEPFLNGVASLIKRLSTTNIRIWPDDVRLMLSQLPDGILNEVYILFPDPWPKRKQHQRRLINAEFLSLIANKLKQGGELNIATDHIDYAKWILEHVSAHEGFIWREDYIGDTEHAFDFVNLTRYYKKAAKIEMRPHFFRLNRK